MSCKKLNDADIEELVSALDQNPNITSLDLSSNNLTKASAILLSKNTTLRTLVLKKGNPAIKIEDLLCFCNNQTLTYFPIQGGSGTTLKTIRDHIKENERVGSIPRISHHFLAPVPVEKVLKPKKNLLNVKKVYYLVTKAKKIWLKSIVIISNYLRDCNV